MASTTIKRVLPLALFASSLAWADLVGDVRGAVDENNFATAASLIRDYEARHGQTPQSILALSWMARGALNRKDYAKAEAYARDTYQRSISELRKRLLDREPDLPLALGAAIEVQGMVLAARGQREDSVEYLKEQLQKYTATSIHARIQKNINLLSLEGKPAPPLKGVSLPPGKPVLIFFWAHWCGDCRAEAPTLARIKSEFGPKGLVLAGATQKYGYAAGGEEASSAAELRYIEEIRKQYYSAVIEGPAVVSEENFLTFGVSTTPTLALIDRHGIVRLYHPGAMTHDELRSAVEIVLTKP